MQGQSRHAIVSTVGVSLLHHGAAEAERKRLLETTHRREAELSPPERDFVRQRAEEGRAALAAGEVEAGRASAEANTLIALGQAGPRSCHYLLYSDTYQGETAACLLAEWLSARGAVVTSQVLCGLTAADSAAFARGIDALLSFWEATLAGLREQGWCVTFNLSGGFKGLQAYLQTLGMFTADEVVYRFEGEGSSLLRIPRLPVTWDPEPLRRQAAVVGRLAQGGVVPGAAVAGLPEVYLEIDARGDATLSYWGYAAWTLQKKQILADRLVEQPGLTVSDGFRRDWERRRDPVARVVLQEALARAAVGWSLGGLAALRADAGLRYEDYRGRRDGVGHFRLNDGLRASCRPEAGKLLLRRWGPHDEVNANP
jgi:CRISPR/Cas system-associated protein Csm6